MSEQVEAEMIKQEVPELRTIITISVNRDNQLVVAAPFDKPALCLNALADAIRIIADKVSEPKVIT
jgi:hypothetical protein